MGIEIYPFPKVNSNMVTPALSKFTRPRTKVNLGLSKGTFPKKKPRREALVTIYDLGRTYEEWK